PYLTVVSGKLFEGGFTDGQKPAKAYHTAFDAAKTRFIWVDFQAQNKLKKDWKAEIIFNFYNDARQLKGRTEELIEVKADQENFSVSSGWGSDHKGTWFKDNYTLEIVFMDTLIGVIPFQVGDELEIGESQILLPGESGIGLSGVPAAPEPEPQTLEEVLEDLHAMIGLDSVKNRISEYAQYLKFLNLRQEKGYEDQQPQNLHVVFAGNPGTGKTTVARMLGQIYKKLGLLTKGHVHEVDRAELIGEYIGQTAPKVKASIDKARGGILFIDEAYALARNKDDTKDYGREVIEMLVKEMTSKKGDLAIVVAGYPKEMETFLDANPGLKSRFTMRFDFPDYLPEELVAIAKRGAEKASVTFTPEALTYLEKKLIDAFRDRDNSFGNARYALSLVNEAKMNLGLRIMQTDDPATLSDEALTTIQAEDVETIFEGRQQRRAKLPVDEPLLHEALDELSSLVGLGNVKNEVQEMVKLVRFYKEIGKDVLHRFSLHTVFIGNPGTGKTTVARIIGKLYKALGILERGNLVECDRADLVAGYIGQTAIKTAEVIEKARGGVLFIDEAYSLVEGQNADFGKEAVNTLLKRMEDLRGELVVIAAGYPDNMKRFLESNPGLKSRFDRLLTFQDYDAKELLEIVRIMLQEEGVTMTPEAEAHLHQYFGFLHQNRNKFFGNARAVRKVVETAIKNQHLRLAALPAADRTEGMIKQLELADISDFEAGSDSLLEGGGQRRVGF
ncbi:MAG: AAA family ATPase, partial [Bacteroidota bacterium]